ncbi:MAG: hypothetical protein AOA65_1318 [Candidatus Bathyarchaeota archaeon BA1]|nr:MAG: hypothetical protein AOA65_1318 [Candidatus Bathyarchaeota archaeon BA1]
MEKHSIIEISPEDKYLSTKTSRTKRPVEGESSPPSPYNPRDLNSFNHLFIKASWCYGMMGEVEELFRDAERLYEEALKDLESDRVRKASENAWCATLRATDALILARTGERPVRSDLTTKWLHELRSKDQNIEILIGRYHTRSDLLHGLCFYLGACEPVEELKRRIVETGEYIVDARRLAGYSHQSKKLNL